MRERFMWREFVKIVREQWQAKSGSHGTYRPDLHYMRGPGPKWHAKYGHLPPKAAAESRGSTLTKVAGHHA